MIRAQHDDPIRLRAVAQRPVRRRVAGASAGIIQVGGDHGHNIIEVVGRRFGEHLLETGTGGIYAQRTGMGHGPGAGRTVFGQLRLIERVEAGAVNQMGFVQMIDHPGQCFRCQRLLIGFAKRRENLVRCSLPIHELKDEQGGAGHR